MKMNFVYVCMVYTYKNKSSVAPTNSTWSTMLQALQYLNHKSSRLTPEMFWLCNPYTEFYFDFF